MTQLLVFLLLGTATYNAVVCNWLFLGIKEIMLLLYNILTPRHSHVNECCTKKKSVDCVMYSHYIHLRVHVASTFPYCAMQYYAFSLMYVQCCWIKVAGTCTCMQWLCHKLIKPSRFFFSYNIVWKQESLCTPCVRPPNAEQNIP